MPRVYKRRFDYEEARRLYREGALIEALALKFGVSTSRMWQVVTPGEMERRAAYSKALARRAVCEECGVQVNRFSKKQAWKKRLCVSCSAKQRRVAYAASRVRESELLCSRCKIWKPDAEFRGNGPELRRGRQAICRACETAYRRSYRQRHQASERETNRIWRAKRRASQAKV